jgi:hypothetical protein
VTQATAAAAAARAPLKVLKADRNRAAVLFVREEELSEESHFQTCAVPLTKRSLYNSRAHVGGDRCPNGQFAKRVIGSELRVKNIFFWEIRSTLNKHLTTLMCHDSSKKPPGRTDTLF